MIENLYRHGLALFNSAHFFDAREVLEDVWRSLPRDRPARRHLQELAQLEVAFYHESKGSMWVRARAVLGCGCPRLLLHHHHPYPQLP